MQICELLQNFYFHRTIVRQDNKNFSRCNFFIWASDSEQMSLQPVWNQIEKDKSGINIKMVSLRGNQICFFKNLIKLQIAQEFLEFKSFMKSSTIAQKLNLQQLMTSLKMLNQQSDQSREEVFNPHFNDESYHSIHAAQQVISPIIPQEIGHTTLGQICRKQTHSHWAHGNEVAHTLELKQMNRKLFEDNKALIKQCIRLRTIIKEGKPISSRDHQSYEMNSLQLMNLEYINQINKLKMENMELKVLNQSAAFQSRDYEQELMVKNLQQLKMSNNRISRKIQELIEKQRSNKLSRSNTTTITSKADDCDRDRMISNIKIVYENQIKNLQSQIQCQKQEITRLNRATSQQSFQSPPKPKLMFN